LFRMAVAAAVWFYLVEDSASCHYQCGFQGSLLRLGVSSTSFTVASPSTVQYLILSSYQEATDGMWV